MRVPLARGSADPALFAHLPEVDRPEFVIANVEQIFERAIRRDPRSLQKRIGPSEIGEPCTRALAHKLHGDAEPERQLPTKAWVGTAIHAELLDKIIPAADPTKAMYLTETRVSVGEINGMEIKGSCDLFDWQSGTVIDLKTKSKSMLSGHKRNGPGEKYRIQFHLYGRGMQRAGHTVNTVAAWFIGRDSEWSERLWWYEPYSEQVAIDALNRATAVAQLVDALGIDAVVGMYPECDDRYCAWCSSPRPYSTTPAAPATTASLFATA